MEVGKIYLVVFLCQFGITYVTATDRECSAFCVQPDTGLACDNMTGDCLQGCQPGYAGSKCNVQCCSNCNDCTLKQGSVTAIVCNGCAKDYYLSGGNCKPCSDNCAENITSSASLCRQTDGRCEFGCVEGFYGDTCMSQCSATCHGNTCNSDGLCANECFLPVVTGLKCMDSCSEGCVKRECSQIGTCLDGCTPNYWNSDCQAPCSAYCHKPLDLDTRVCNVSTGFCLHGCVNNTFWDTNCSTECSLLCLPEM